MDEQTGIKKAKTVHYERAERALDIAGITDPAIRGEALSLIERFQEILDQNRQDTRKLGAHYRPQEPFIYRILRDYGEQLDAQPPTLQLRQMKSDLRNALKSRQYAFNKANRDRFPDLKPLYADTIVTRSMVECLISDMDRAWLAKYRLEQVAPEPAADSQNISRSKKNSSNIEVPAPRQEPVLLLVLRKLGHRIDDGKLLLNDLDEPINQNLRSRQTNYERKFGQLSPDERFVATTRLTRPLLERLMVPGDHAWLAKYGWDGDPEAPDRNLLKPDRTPKPHTHSAAPQQGGKSDTGHTLPSEEPTVLAILRQLAPRVDAGTLYFRDLINPVQRSLRNREYYYRLKHHRWPNPEKLGAGTCLTRQVLERMMLPADRAWLSEQKASGEPQLPIRDLLKPAKEGYALANRHAKHQMQTDPTEPATHQSQPQQGAKSNTGHVAQTTIAAPPPAAKVSIPAGNGGFTGRTLAGKLPVDPKPPAHAEPAAPVIRQKPAGFSMFTSLVAERSAANTSQRPPFESFGVRKRHWADAKAASAEGRAIPADQLAALDICAFLKASPYWNWQGRLEKGIELDTLRRVDPAAADEWDARRIAISSFLVVYCDTPDEDRIRFPGTQDEHVSKKPNASALPERQRVVLQKLEASLKTNDITLKAVQNLATATEFMSKFSDYHPISSEMDPKTRADALKKIRSFPRLGEADGLGPSAEQLFEKHWQRPILLKVLTLGDFRKYDPDAYRILAETGTNELFNRLNRVLTSAGSTLDLARPSSAPQMTAQA